MKTAAILITSLLLTQIPLQPVTSSPRKPTTRIAQADLTDGTLTPQEVQQKAKSITVRITSENNGGSGVIIAQSGTFRPPSGKVCGASTGNIGINYAISIDLVRSFVQDAVAGKISSKPTVTK